MIWSLIDYPNLLLKVPDIILQYDNDDRSSNQEQESDQVLQHEEHKPMDLQGLRDHEVEGVGDDVDQAQPDQETKGWNTSGLLQIYFLDSVWFFFYSS